jgi:hypothetical protein
VKLKFVGVAHGRDGLVCEFVWRTSDEVRLEWGTGTYAQRIPAVCEASPGVKCQRSTFRCRGRMCCPGEAGLVLRQRHHIRFPCRFQ